VDELFRPTFSVDGPRGLGIDDPKFNIPDRLIDTEVTGYGYRHGDQPFYEALWIEKSTMNDVLEPLCWRLGIDFAYTRGFNSITRAIQLLIRARELGKPLRVFTISDYDPGGVHMAPAIARRLPYFQPDFAPDTEIVVRHLGMHREWVYKYDLPPKPIAIDVKSGDKIKARAENFMRRHSEGAVELDALEALHPGALATELREVIREYRDADLSTKLVRAEGEARRIAVDAADEATEDVRTAITDETNNVAAEIGEYREWLADLERRRDEVVAPYRRRVSELQEEFRTELRPLFEEYRDFIVGFKRRLVEVEGSHGERLDEIETELDAELEELRSEHAGIVAEYDERREERGERLNELEDEVGQIVENLQIELPRRSEPEVAVDESDVLFDSGRHWFDQHLIFREFQGKPIDMDQRRKGCAMCGTEFIGERADSKTCADPDCKRRWQNLLRAEAAKRRRAERKAAIEPRPCQICGEMFTPKIQGRRGDTCSNPRCQQKAYHRRQKAADDRR
jgi:hypothetical protein